MHDDLFSAPPPRDVLTVSELNRKARQLLETHLSLLWVEGEISNFSAPSSGHWYFTLKDKDAQVRCAMFRSRNALLRFKPALGKHVVLRARVSLYEGRGDYQLIAEHLEEAGFGVLQRAFEALKNKLQKEGLFDIARKRPLPTLPRHVAVITSPSGAAIHDVLTVLGRRFPALPVTLLPAAVQGEGAARQIETALALANRLDRFDVILLTRGGGSLEDLWPFNEEIVARAVAASRLPVVCAVGHEVDFTIADFVADARAPTPSAAAEMISPDCREWLRDLAGRETQLQRCMQRRLEQSRGRLDALRRRLRHPGEGLRHRAQRLDQLEMRLQRAARQRFQDRRKRLEHLAARHLRCLPRQAIRQHRRHIQQLEHSLRSCLRQHLGHCQRRLARLGDLLDAVSPLKTVARGYSLTLDARGRILRDSATVNTGELITTKLARGQLRSRVEARADEYQDLGHIFAGPADRDD